jgi:hypothetical protein
MVLFEADFQLIGIGFSTASFLRLGECSGEGVFKKEMVR